MGNRWSTDLRELLDREAVTIPGPDSRLALYFTDIVKAATALQARRPRATALRCRRFRQRARCPGYLRVRLQDIPAEIHWSCPRCGEQGVLSNWPQSPWDLTGGSAFDRDAPLFRLMLEEELYRELRRADLIDPLAERTVFAAKARDGMVTLLGSFQALKALMRDLGAAAERERLEARRSRLDALHHELRCHLEALSARSGNIIPPGPLPDVYRDDPPGDGLPAIVLGEEGEATWGGLKDEQLHRLLRCSWNNGSRPLRFHPGRVGLKVQKTSLMRNLVPFLKAVRQKGRVKATAAGNLNRRFVMKMIQTLPAADEWREDCLEYRKIWNERDFGVLHLIRQLCQCGGALKLDGKAFRLSKQGCRLLGPGRCGELYFLAFRTLFREFRLSELDRLPDNDGVQASVPFSLYVLASEAAKWVEVGELAPLLLLPEALENMPDSDLIDYPIYLVEARLLTPLADFGLIERRAVQSPPPGHGGTEVRKTELFDEFIEVRV